MHVSCYCAWFDMTDEIAGALPRSLWASRVRVSRKPGGSMGTSGGLV
jgi:hypothetical protein